MEYESKKLGQIIRKERKRRNITLDELSSALNISSTYLGLIEMGKRGQNIKIELLVKIAFIFNVTTDYLIGIESVNTKNEDKNDYEKLLSLYRLMDESNKSKIISIAQILLRE